MLERSGVVAINRDLRERVARIRETNSAKADDVAAVMDAVVALTNGAVEDAERAGEPVNDPPVAPTAPEALPTEGDSALTSFATGGAGGPASGNDAGAGILGTLKSVVGL